MRTSVNTIKGIALVAIFLLSGMFLTSIYAQKAITSEQAHQKLIEGNKRFFAGNAIHANTNKEIRIETAKNGQHPYATIIGCSDSRVPVEIIFDAGIGELFIVRVAGNVVDTDEAGSIEYGVGHLHTPLLVVLGHTKCGAVTAVANGDEVHGSIPKLVDNIIPAVNKAKEKHGNHVDDNLINSSIELNVWQSIEDLLKKSHEVQGLVKENKLKIVGAIYNIETGEINWLGEHPHQKELLGGELHH